MTDTDDSTNDTGVTEPEQRGRLALLILILTLVVGIGALACIGVALGTKALRLVSEFAVHTERAKTSPDGRWRLVIDAYDEGALGGSATVYLEPAKSGDRTYTLHESDWMPNWAVRWLDARTIVLNGRLRMPFVEESIETGSRATCGGAVDAAGCVRNKVAPGERAVMLSGLSLVPPRGSAAMLLTRRDTATGLTWQELRPTSGTTWSGSPSCSILAVGLRGELPDPRVATAGHVVATSLGKRIEVRWDAQAHWLVVHSRLRRRLMGFMWERDVDLQSDAQAARRAEGLWRLFQVETIPPS